jgi:competence protein ComEC
MRYLAWFSFAFAAACALFVYVLPTTVAVGAAACALVLACCCLLCRTDIARHVAVCLIGLSLGFGWCAVYQAAWMQPLDSLADTTQELTATVCDEMQTTQYGYSVTVRAELADRTVKTLLYLTENGLDLQPGDTVTLSAYLSSTTGSEDAYYNAKGVRMVAYQKAGCTVTRPEKTPLRDRPALLRIAIKRKIAELFPSDTAPFAVALLTGDKTQMDDLTRAELRVAGVYHVVAVSGMHVSCLLSFLLLGIRARRRRAALIGIPAVLLMIAVIGGTPGVTRAGILYLFALTAPLLRREADTPTSLGAALLVMLMANPWAIGNVALQLSFAATAGIFLFSPRLSRALLRTATLQTLRTAHRRIGVAVDSLVQVLATTLSALVFTVPLMAYWFGTISLIAPLSNLLVVPIVSVCFVLSLVAVALGALLPTLGGAVAWLASWPIRYLLLVAHTAAQAPYASVSTDAMPVVLWLVFAYAVLLLCLRIPALRARPVIPVCSVILTLLAVLTGMAVQWNAGSFAISALDVGQGQCIVLTADGFSAAVDCGGSDDAQTGDSCAQFFMDGCQRRLDYLILTHFDSDHVSGAAELLRRMEVGILFLPQTDEDSEAKTAVLEAAEETGTRICYVTSDCTITVGETTLKIFAPLTSGDSNNSGLSVLFTYGDYDALITGDMSIATEGLLLKNKAIPDLELLVAGHHGSKNSTGEALLEQTMPETVLISVGPNSYGHPTEETLERIEVIDAAIYRTDECGTITIRR